MNDSPFVQKRGFDYGVEHRLVTKPQRLMDYLQSEVHLSTDGAQSLIQMGAIYLNQERTLTNEEIHSGDYLRIHTKPRRFEINQLKLSDILIDENSDFLVLNKPHGIPVHASVDNIKENLHAFLVSHYGPSIGVTHRLDIGTSGLIIFSKTKPFQKDFNSLLSTGSVNKFYRAIVHGETPITPLLEHHMEPSPRAPKKVSRSQGPGWAYCKLEVIDQEVPKKNFSELLLKLHTGRTHQIRSQLSFEGHPVLGDKLYGSPVSLKKDEWALQSFSLSFEWSSKIFHWKIPAENYF